MPTEAVALIPEPAGPPTLEAVPDLPVAPVAEIAAGLTAALVTAWNAVRARHPDIPEAVISMATGGRASAVELAHFAPRRWRAREGDTVHHEVFVTAESLADGADKVFGYLLHEAVHAANEARGNKDCSASQYHNKEFRKVAQELGLIEREGIDPDWRKKYGSAGFSVLSEEARATYSEQIAALDAAMHATAGPMSSEPPHGAARRSGRSPARTWPRATTLARRSPGSRRRRIATTSRRSASVIRPQSSGSLRRPWSAATSCAATAWRTSRQSPSPTEWSFWPDNTRAPAVPSQRGSRGPRRCAAVPPWCTRCRRYGRVGRFGVMGCWGPMCRATRAAVRQSVRTSSRVREECSLHTS